MRADSAWDLTAGIGFPSAVYLNCVLKTFLIPVYTIKHKGPANKPLLALLAGPFRYFEGF